MRWLIAVGLMCLVVESCTDDGREQAGYVDAIAMSLASGDPAALNLSDDHARCVARRWVNTIGVDRFESAGIEADDVGNESDDVALATVGFSQADGNELYDAFAACDVDIEQAIVAASGLGEEGSRCLADAVHDDFLRALMVATFTNPEAGSAPPSELDRVFERILQRCGDNEKGSRSD